MKSSDFRTITHSHNELDGLQINDVSLTNFGQANT